MISQKMSPPSLISTTDSNLACGFMCSLRVDIVSGLEHLLSSTAPNMNDKISGGTKTANKRRLYRINKWSTYCLPFFIDEKWFEFLCKNKKNSTKHTCYTCTYF